MLKGESTLYQHPKGSTLYVTIPAKIASDSQFAFKKGERVRIVYIPGFNKIEVQKLDQP